MASTSGFGQRLATFNSEGGQFINGSTYSPGPESMNLTSWVPSIHGVSDSSPQHTDIPGRSTIFEQRQPDSSTSDRTTISVTRDRVDYINIDITTNDAQTIRQEIASKIFNNPCLQFNIYRMASAKSTSALLDDDGLLIACLTADDQLKFFVDLASSVEPPELPLYAQAPSFYPSHSISLPAKVSVPGSLPHAEAAPAGGSKFSLHADPAAQHVADPDRSRYNYKDRITNPVGNAGMAEPTHGPSTSQQLSESDGTGFSVPYYDDSPIIVDTPISTTSIISGLPSPPPTGRPNIARNTLHSEPYVMTKTEQVQRYGESSPDAAGADLLQNGSPGQGPAPDGARTGTISRRMTMDEVLHELHRHGCKNITPDLNRSMSTYNPVASGGFGDVYRGILNDGREVGLKCVRLEVDLDNVGQKKVKEAARELYIWSKCKHRNILELIGVTQHRDQIAMVSPWMKHGDITRFLKSHPGADRYRLCAQIAEGVAYLHQDNVVHGDLKGVNVLVSEDHTPKITDFGTASRNECTLKFTETSRSETMSLRWTAPEIVNEGMVRSTPAADVFSLGMTILEVITGKVPFPDTHQPGTLVMKLGIGEHPLRPEEHIPTGNEQADRLWSLLKQCWAFNPTRRPTAIEVRDEMRDIASM